MEAQNPPSKMARVAEPEELGSMRGVSSLIGLGFGSRPLNYGKSGFTFLQFQELEHQALIYKYMVAGVSVPIHLVLPIWKSVVNSYGGVNGGIYQHYPSCSSSLCFDYRNSVEPEPGRCRRTDGKKWRCSKDVVPDQKYCERHMHRGRNRSRKPVETSQVTTAAATIDNTNNNMNSNTNLSISIPGSLQLLTNTTTTTSSVSSGNLNSGNVLQSGSCKTESSL